ncbi:MAG: tRNA (adenosine(37)-N6)-threonylcarbamoyltransferase complex transferase subunit TsaD [Pseudomonadota bacterium]
MTIGNAPAGDLLALGIETSCDETAAAVVRRRADGSAEILSDRIFSQTDAHALYGGVVPEIAARAHLDRLDGLIEDAMAEAGASWADLDLIAATAGPGLIGGVMVGLATGKALSLVHAAPLQPVNHLEAHALSARIADETPFPYLLLLVSGGHTQLIAVEGVGRYRRLGTTIDDAAGEAFDKTAKLLGLGHPGGPEVERRAAAGDPRRFEMPRPLLKHAGCDFSFSGMKTAVRVCAEALTEGGRRLSETDVNDLCAAFQTAAADHLAARTARAMRGFSVDDEGRLVVAGGVAANKAIRARLEAAAGDEGFRLIAPPLRLCTDNAAMVAWAGLERRAAGLADDPEAAYAAPARARWPLDPTPRGKAYGSGRKGAKA